MAEWPLLPRSTEIRPQVAADSSPLPSPSPHYLPARGGSSACLRGLGILELPVSVYGGVPCPYIRGERLGAPEHASGGGRAAPLPASLSLPCVGSTRRRPREPQAWPVPVPRRCAAAFPTLPLLLKRVVSARAPSRLRARAQARGCARAPSRLRNFCPLDNIEARRFCKSCLYLLILAFCGHYSQFWEFKNVSFLGILELPVSVFGGKPCLSLGRECCQAAGCSWAGCLACKHCLVCPWSHGHAYFLQNCVSVASHRDSCVALQCSQ